MDWLQWAIPLGYVGVAAVAARPLARAYYASHERSFPSITDAGTRTESAVFGLLMAAFWPVVIPVRLLISWVRGSAFRKEYEAEAELERAELYAKAREIVRKADAADEAALRKQFRDKGIY